MGSPYNGLFIRHAMGDTPSAQGTGWSACPDIILAGTQPATDPSVYTSAAGYATDYGSTLFVGQQNDIYVRALNSSPAALTGRIWLYYAQSDMVLWTYNWQSTPIQVGGQAQNYTTLSAPASNAIVVTNPPFLVTPPKPAAGQHYCMIAFAENPPLSDPPQSPVPQGSMGTFNDLVNFILTHPNMGWRNTVDVVQNIPTFQFTVPITNAKQGGQLYIGIQCKDMTSGSFSFSVPGPDKQNTIIVPQTPITNPYTNLTIPVTWPASFPQSSITINYYAATAPTPPPPAGASISAVVIIPTSSYVDDYCGGSELAYLRRFGTPQQFFAFDSPTREAGGPIYAHIIGSNPFRFR